MSYAKVTAANAPPLSQQPTPDPALLTTHSGTPGLVDDTSKVNVAPRDFKENPHTVTSESIVIQQYESSSDDNRDASKNARKQKAKKKLLQAEEEGVYLWSRLEEQLLRPGVAGGLIGIVNVGLLATVGYQFYTRPAIRSDAKVIGSTIAGAVILFSAEGYGVEAYRKTNRGHAEERRARKEGAALYRHSKEIILRPGVLGGLVGVVNVGILGTIGYFAYQNRDLPRWDKQIVSATTIGLITLSLGEGFLAEQYSKKEYPRRK